MNPPPSKRNRGCNYTIDEKHLLLTLVNKNKNIIENKKTDAVNNAEKEKTWVKIVEEFNAQSASKIFRDLQSLKKLYNNMKKDLRKDVADEKMDIIKTGGGPAYQKCRDPLRELALDTVNTKTVYGFHNKFDKDSNIRLDYLSEINIEVTEHEDLSKEDEIIELVKIEDGEHSSFAWSKMKVKNLKQPLNSSLKQKVQHDALDNDLPPALPSTSGTSTTNKESRRRPHSKAVLASSDISKIYCELGEEKLKNAKLENIILENKVKYDQEKDELELQILKADLAIKMKELAKHT